jgi:hypothetical protein
MNRIDPNNLSKMLDLIFFLGFLGISCCCNSQDINPKKREEKEATKFQTETTLDSLVQSGRFVFVANFQSGYSFVRQPCDPTLHFIKIDGTEGILQEGFDHDTPYGSGMSTLKGSIANYKISSVKNHNYKITFDLRSGGSVFKLLLTVSEDNNVTSEMDGHIKMDGRLVALDKANIIVLQKN